MSLDDGASWDDHWPRPSRLLPRPEPVETMALLPDNPPVWFSWRGQRRRVRRADGPERVFGEWWKREAEAAIVSEQKEPVVRLRAMPKSGEVVEDYGHVGLTLRQHPVSLLRAELARRRHITCAEAMDSRDRRWVEVAGLVLVRQRPGSSKGVMFITIEDETGVANLVV